MTMQAEITMNPITAGTFCWNELATSDTNASESFYGSLFGWAAETTECGGKQYTMFKKEGHPIAGMMGMDENWPKGMTPHWGAYIAVDDIDATAAKVTSCGGTVCCGPMDAGDEGKFAVLTDPTGATFSIFQGGDGMNPCGFGSFCWNELSTTDTEAATAFYTNLFGWTSSIGHASSEPYTEFKNAEASACGMMKMHWEGNPSWLGYVHVASVDDIAATAVELGAHLCVEPTDIPTIGRFAVFTDPLGATIGVFTCLSGCGEDCGCS